MKLYDLFEVDAEKLRKAMGQQTKAVKREEKWRKHFAKKRKEAGRKPSEHPRLQPMREELEVSIHDPLEILIKYARELQAELQDAKREGEDPEIVDQIEQDLYDIGELIQQKKQMIRR